MGRFLLMQEMGHFLSRGRFLLMSYRHTWVNMILKGVALALRGRGSMEKIYLKIIYYDNVYEKSDQLVKLITFLYRRKIVVIFLNSTVQLPTDVSSHLSVKSKINKNNIFYLADL